MTKTSKSVPAPNNKASGFAANRNTSSKRLRKAVSGPRTGISKSSQIQLRPGRGISSSPLREVSGGIHPQAASSSQLLPQSAPSRRQQEVHENVTKLFQSSDSSLSLPSPKTKQNTVEQDQQGGDTMGDENWVMKVHDAETRAVAAENRAKEAQTNCDRLAEKCRKAFRLVETAQAKAVLAEQGRIDLEAEYCEVINRLEAKLEAEIARHEAEKSAFASSPRGVLHDTSRESERILDLQQQLTVIRSKTDGAKGLLQSVVQLLG
ncbi:hypothetical protein K439DRAFT_1628674 [Ramaria rubella]|nr:hypothetical protein K439DRAFT_1628674 [Ramaria rubella]